MLGAPASGASPDPLRTAVGDSENLRICVLGSGSRGNATFVATDAARVLFDAGFSCRQIARRLESIGEDVRALDAVVVSHEHSDHVRGLEVLARQTGVRIFVTPLTASALSWTKSAPDLATFEAGRSFVIGDLEIETFTVSHDAIDPVGFCVCNNGCKISIATDLGYITDSVRYHLASSRVLVIESNHDLEMLKSGPYPWELKQRVMSRDGHLSNTAVAEYLASDWDRQARAIVLAHLSENNNHPAIAEMDARKAIDSVGAGATAIYVAQQQEPLPVIEL